MKARVVELKKTKCDGLCFLYGFSWVHPLLDILKVGLNENLFYLLHFFLVVDFVKANTKFNQPVLVKLL